MLNQRHDRSATLPILLMASIALPATTSLAAGDPSDDQAFAPKIGVCTSLNSAELLQQSGADYIEAGVRWFLVPDKPDADFAENLKAAQACKLPIRTANGFLPGSLKCVGPNADHEAMLAYAQTAFERARQVGIEIIVFGSSGARGIPDGFDRDQAEQQFIDLLKKMGPLAQAQGVTVVIEPLNRKECNFINTVPEGARIVRAVNHPNIQLLADIYHMLRMDEPPQHIRDAGRLIRHVHIAEKQDRTPPGVHGDDFTGYFQALAEIGYTGRISIECGWKDMPKQLSVAITTMRDQISKVSVSPATRRPPDRTPPEGALVLFDGRDFAHWQHEKGGPVKWDLADGALEVVPGTGSIMTQRSFQDFRLHVEFNVPKLPPLPEGADRGNRGNSGVYLQRRYEVQILDSCGVKLENWDCGSLYRAKAPDTNASKPAGEWQTYDIEFHAPHWEGTGDDAHKIANARITVFHNGVLIHDDVELKNKTGAGQLEGPQPGPILLQDHGNQVRFRNIWIVPLD
jgi:sugar phosphate isomerase/epimerase